MKTSKSICVSLLVLTGLMSVARGEDYRMDINPALLYYQSFLVAPKDADIEYLTTNECWRGWWNGETLPDQFGSGVSNCGAELELVKQASHQTVSCNWGIDLSRGAETLLPQLACAKRAVIHSQSQIMWDLQKGNQAEACEDLLADLALGRNIAQNRTLISGLVEIAIESLVCSEFAQNFHRFSPETLQQLADGFDAGPPQGTVAECVSSEEPIRSWYLIHLKNIKNQYPNDNAGAINALHQFLYYYSSEDWEQLTNGTGGTIDGVIEAVGNSEPLFAELGQVLALPYSEYEGRFKYDSQPGQLRARFEKTGNPFFLRLVSEWCDCRHREFRVQVDLAMMRAAIEYKLHGGAGLESVADPCGDGPFTFQRFVMNGVDRGFELKSRLNRAKGIPEAYIFVEAIGPPFNVMGLKRGQPVTESWP